jgi:hypothetical protein
MIAEVALTAADSDETGRADDEAISSFLNAISDNRTWRGIVARNETPGIAVPSLPAVSKHEERYRDWLSNGKPKPLSKYLALRKSALEFYRWAYRERQFVFSDDHLILAEAIGKTIGLTVEDNRGAFGNLSGKWAGTYYSFRESRDPLEETGGRKYVRATVQLTYKGSVPWFYHRSEQVVRGKKVLYNHDGPVFCFGNTIFLLGLVKQGIRQWTISGDHEPKNKVLAGIALTKADVDSGYVPMAVKTAFFHKSLLPDVEEDRSKIYAEIDRVLQNDPSELPTRLYAWPYIGEQEDETSG